MVGDSITHFGQWPQLLPEFDTINFGISGNTTAQLADRLDPILQSAPDQIALLIGTNDIGLSLGTPHEVVAATVGIVEVLSTAAPVILHTIPPRQPEFAGPLRQINAGIAALAARSSASLVDLWPIFDDGSGALRDDLGTDGLHFSSLGYQVWTRELLKVLSTGRVGGGSCVNAEVWKPRDVQRP